MRSGTIARRMCGATLLASLALALTLALATGAHAAGKLGVGPPAVTTGAASQVRGTSATLLGTVNPRGAVTTYYFLYGPTIAYGKQTTPATLPAGIAKVKVGQAVTGLLPGYHYRLVGTNGYGTKLGKDHAFGLKSTELAKPKFTLAKSPESTPFGSPFVLSGSIAGVGSANRKLALQSSAFPYLTPFTTIGLPTLTNAFGRFSFRVPSLSTSTQFRVSTLDPRPAYSPIVTHRVAVRVTLKVRTTRHKGLVRLYGTVTPARVGAPVRFQLLKPVRPGKSEKETRFATQFSSVVKRGTKTIARFSAIERIQRGGSYRAYVVVRTGALVSGASTAVLLHAAPGSTGKAGK
jgi:hypothetical protein